MPRVLVQMRLQLVLYLLLLLLLDIEAAHRECAQVPRRTVLRPDVAKLAVDKILHVEPIRVLQYRGIIGKAGMLFQCYSNPPD